MNPGERARADQARAAQREAVRRLEARAKVEPGSEFGDDHPDPWVHALGDFYERLLLDGGALWCPHLRPGAGPQPLHAAAWMPSLIACDLCVLVGVFVVEGAADRICDRCGLDTLEVGISQGAATVGPLTIAYGICPSCFEQIRRRMRRSTS
jgi:hypothetical protein